MPQKARETEPPLTPPFLNSPMNESPFSTLGSVPVPVPWTREEWMQLSSEELHSHPDFAAFLDEWQSSLTSGSAQDKYLVLMSGLYTQPLPQTAEAFVAAKRLKKSNECADVPDFSAKRVEMLIWTGIELASPRQHFFPGLVEGVEFLLILRGILAASHPKLSASHPRHGSMDEILGRSLRVRAMLAIDMHYKITASDFGPADEEEKSASVRRESAKNCHAFTSPLPLPISIPVTFAEWDKNAMSGGRWGEPNHDDIAKRWGVEIKGSGRELTYRGMLIYLLSHDTPKTAAEVVSSPDFCARGKFRKGRRVTGAMVKKMLAMAWQFVDVNNGFFPGYIEHYEFVATILAFVERKLPKTNAVDRRVICAKFVQSVALCNAVDAHFGVFGQRRGVTVMARDLANA